MYKFINFITSFRNILNSKRGILTIDWSLQNENVLKIFLKMSFIIKYKVTWKENFKLISVFFINNSTSNVKFINTIKCISLSGRRVFTNYLSLNQDFLRLPGIFIISTSKGVLSHKEAIRLKLGGEVMLNIL
jgi:small subunit ribosomal protein S8